MYFEITAVISIKDLDISIRCLFSHINTKREITTHNTQHSHAYLTLFQRVAPAGVKWTGHSLCLGGASVVRAISVDLYMIMAQGLWASMSSVQQDLHFDMLPHAAAYISFGCGR